MTFLSRPAMAWLAAAGLLLAGCSSPSAPSGPAPSGDGPVQPKVNRVVMAVEPPSIESNEPRNIGQPPMWQIKPMYEYLIGIDPVNGKLTPELATDWSMDPKTLAVTFKLRSGVQFHNGYGEFGAKDVLYSWQDLTQKDSFHTQAQYWRDIIKGIDTPNEREAVLHLSAVDGGFLRAISDGESTLEIRSKAMFTAKGAPTMTTEPTAGTGAYQYQSRQQAQYLRYQRVPYQHWRATPDFPEFEFRFVKEASTRLATLLTGEVQMASLPQDALAQAESRGFTTLKGRVAGLRVFGAIKCCYVLDPKDHSKGMRYPEAPLQDVRVRRALQKAINLNELNKAFFAGKGETMILNHFHSTREGWNPDWEKRFEQESGYDPAAAKALLAQAGQSNLETNFILGPAAGVPGANDIAEAIATYWRAIGVKVNLLNIDPTEVTNSGRQQKFSNHFQIAGTSSALLFGAAVWNANVGKSGAYPSAEDPESDDVLNQLYATLDPAQQEPLFRKLGDRMFGQHLNLNLFWLPAEMTVDSKIVADYVFPGSISGLWTHVQNIKAAR